MAMGLANAVLDVMHAPGFDKHILEVSKYFFEQLSNIQNKFPKIIKEVRGKGLMIGLQFFEDPSKLLKEFYKNICLAGNGRFCYPQAWRSPESWFL